MNFRIRPIKCSHAYGLTLKPIPNPHCDSRIVSIIRSASSQAKPDAVIHIPRADVYRFGDGNKAAPIFKDFEWTVQDGENWAIVGPAGSEKSALLDMLLGYTRLSPSPPGGLYPFLYNRSHPLDPHDNISLVSFTSRRRAAGGAFVDYTVRYGAVRDEDRLTLRDALFAAVKSAEGTAELDDLAERLDLRKLLDLPFVILSNGQTRRARIANALLGKPELPFPQCQSFADLEQKANSHNTVRPEGKELVVMKDVNVRYHDRHVLKYVNWTIKEGEKWHLQGANGSGKATLLSILTGDHPQSYIQPISNLTLFSRPRRHQATASLQRLIGCTSPEIFSAFPRRTLTVRDAIGTGFEGTFSYRPLAPTQSTRVDELISSLGPSQWSTSESVSKEDCEKFAERKFADLVPGEQSVVLLMRALVGKAPLVILDEVFSGMDRRMVDVSQRYLREQLDPKQAVVFVTHWEEEVPWSASVMRRIRLEDGIAKVNY